MCFCVVLTGCLRQQILVLSLVSVGVAEERHDCVLAVAFVRFI